MKRHWKPLGMFFPIGNSRLRNPNAHLQHAMRFKPTRVILLSFVYMIGIGTLLLMLPWATTDGQGLHPVDALFVSTSASCVCGLTVVDVHHDLTTFGTIVLGLLLQIGGLGIMTLAALVYHSLGHRLQLNESLAMQESLNQGGQKGLVDLIQRIIRYTLFIEGFFALLLAIHFYPEFGFKAIGYGIFHSVSAFCNGGFDLFGNYDSLCKRNGDIFLLACLAILIQLGSLGFTVLYELANKRSWRKFSLHTKIVLVANTILILIGMLLVLAVEYNNPDTIGNLSLTDKLANTCFNSISCRTAGFNTFDLSKTEQISQLTMIIIMFIGAAPMSTGGGIKSTTFAIIVLSMWSVFRGRREIVVFGRRITRNLRDRAFAIFTMGTIWVVTAGIILSILDGEQNELLEVIFETVSGFATVGMGIGITLEWNLWGKLVLSLTMLVGRVGIMTFMLSLIEQDDKIIKYPPENIMIG